MVKKYRVPMHNEGGFFDSFDVVKMSEKTLLREQICYGTFTIHGNGHLSLFRAAGADLPKKVSTISSVDMNTETTNHV
jgi:hypothetical protein